MTTTCGNTDDKTKNDIAGCAAAIYSERSRLGRFSRWQSEAAIHCGDENEDDNLSNRRFVSDVAINNTGNSSNNSVAHNNSHNSSPATEVESDVTILSEIVVENDSA